MKRNIVFLILIVIGAGLVLWGFSYRSSSSNDTTGGEQVFCTADAFQCSDGSWVGRTGPRCEFVCPNATTTAATTTGGGGGIVPFNSGVKGTVMVGPTCPVMQNPPQSGCEDKPLSTLVAIFRVSDPVHAYVITRSDSLGKFTSSLAPGEYTIGAGESNLPRCPQTKVTVVPDKYLSVTINCDSGIR